MALENIGEKVMKSKVYFTNIRKSDDTASIAGRLDALIQKSNLLDLISVGDKTAIKLHFGEEGNTGYVRPEYLRIIVDRLKQRQAQPFLADTNTLYRGRRTNSAEHLKLAYEHGFTPDKVNAEVIIPDDTKKENVSAVAINGKFVKIAKIARVFRDAAAIVGVAHFKGHMMTGFGGALKNLGMGCATREGKLAQHCDVSPFVITKKCTGCQACIAVCPAGAITLKDGKAFIDNAKCIGCASCIAACDKYHAIEIKWESGGESIQEKMIEYAKAVLNNKKDKAVFFNFALKITKECDCLAKDDPRIAPDVGIFASIDPVSLDKASFDLVVRRSGKDIFKEAHPERDGMKQLEYAVKLGLGNMEYELIDLSA
jgi:uncharacterized Fe-S center protein